MQIWGGVERYKLVFIFAESSLDSAIKTQDNFKLICNFPQRLVA